MNIIFPKLAIFKVYVNANMFFRPGDHLSSEAAEFMHGYIGYLTRTLKFYPRVRTRVNIALKKIAKEMHLKPNEVTYVGIHNRRTDYMDFVNHKLNLVNIEVLEEDYFLSGMEYFRYLLIYQ